MQMHQDDFLIVIDTAKTLIQNVHSFLLPRFESKKSNFFFVFKCPNVRKNVV